MKIMMLNQDNLNDEPIFVERSRLFQKGEEIIVEGRKKYVIDCAHQDAANTDREYVGSYSKKAPS